MIFLTYKDGYVRKYMSDIKNLAVYDLNLFKLVKVVGVGFEKEVKKAKLPEQHNTEIK